STPARRSRRSRGRGCVPRVALARPRTRAGRAWSPGIIGAMRDRLASSILLAAAAAAALGCAELKDAYGKEYVLHDSRRAAHARRAGATGGADARGARDQAGRRADDRTDDEAGPQDTDEASFARLVQLEHVRGEIERAILDGLDEGGDLARKRRAIDAE